jgi:hypothetical protein
VHVGMEDTPFIEPGIYARTNADLVEKIVRISRDVGREVASVGEARRICGLGERVAGRGAFCGPDRSRCRQIPFGKLPRRAMQLLVIGCHSRLSCRTTGQH